MKTVRLTSALYRAWRANTPQWVSPDGTVLRGVTPEEEQALFEGRERVKRTRQTTVLPLVARYTQGEQVIERPFRGHFVVTQTGNTPDAFFIEVFVSGNRYMAGRDVLKMQLLHEHGECIVLGLNGKRVAFVRDPDAVRPTFAESQTNVPQPAACACRQWNGTEPGRHHFICEFNARAPIEQRASRGRPPSEVSSSQGRTIPGLAFTAPGSAPPTLAAALPTPPAVGQAPATIAEPNPGLRQVSSPTAAHRPELVPLHSPEQCPNDCRGHQPGALPWGAPASKPIAPGHHHPMCKYADAWRDHISREKKWVLFDLDARQALRPATAEEVAEAQLAQQRTGMATITLGGAHYAVIELGAPAPRPQPPPQPLQLAGTKLERLATTIEVPSEQSVMSPSPQQQQPADGAALPPADIDPALSQSIPPPLPLAGPPEPPSPIELAEGPPPPLPESAESSSAESSSTVDAASSPAVSKPRMSLPLIEPPADLEVRPAAPCATPESASDAAAPPPEPANATAPPPGPPTPAAAAGGAPQPLSPSAAALPQPIAPSPLPPPANPLDMTGQSIRAASPHSRQPTVAAAAADAAALTAAGGR